MVERIADSTRRRISLFCAVASLLEKALTFHRAFIVRDRRFLPSPSRMQAITPTILPNPEFPSLAINTVRCLFVCLFFPSLRFSHSEVKYDTIYFFLGPRKGSPMLEPVRRTLAAFCSLSTASMAGKSAPVRSRSATTLTSTLAFDARSF